ncbi:hypothetical protein [Actinomadura rudentiformis]|uniref:hypothetical protein n=1 Tax=Actinomadura rudentiformis TaxID=359158 RepID=UPI00178C177F|nr:hypothetical protein [Actinomadura rudentiformis]
MTRITVHNDNLNIEIEGLHRLWAFKRRLTIPLAHVQHVSGNPDRIRRPPIGWSLGFWAPGLIVAGTFCSRGKREFWDIRHPTKAIIIDLANDRHTRLVLEVEDPQSVIDMITQARRGTSPS